MATSRTSTDCSGPAKQNRRAMPLPVIESAGNPHGTVRVSRSGPRRAIVLTLLTLLMVAHVVQWRLTGRTVSPIEPSESMRFLQYGELNAGFIFFTLAILATAVFGRFVCGWGCHIVALQDLCGWAMKRCGVRPRPFRSRLLGYVPLIAALYMFVWPSAFRLVTAETEFPPVSNHLLTEHFWDTFPPWQVAVPFLLICGFATVYFLGAKGYCTFACPYGGFFAPAAQLSPLGIRVTDACHQCGHCTAVCTSNVRVHQEVRDFGMVVDPGCMRCLDCVSVCPNDALYFGIGMPAAWAKPRHAPAAAVNHSGATRLPWLHEIALCVAFALSFVALRGVYEAVPFLMALGCAAIAAMLGHRAIELIIRPDVSLQSLVLRRGGRLQPTGAAFLAFSLATWALIAHCGWIRLNESAGEAAFVRIAIPEEPILLGHDLTQWMTPDVRAALADCRARFSTCERHGLLKSAHTQLRLAWLDLIEGQSAGAAERFALAAAGTARSARATLRYFEGCTRLLNRQTAEAVTAFDLALANDARHAAALSRQGEAFALLGDLNKAISNWQAVIKLNPSFAPAYHNLAGAARLQSRLEESVALYGRALELSPNDADSHFQLGVVLTQLGREAEAGAHFARAVEENPKYRELLESAPK